MPKSKLSGSKLIQKDTEPEKMLPIWEYELKIDNNPVVINMRTLIDNSYNPTEKNVLRKEKIINYSDAFNEQLTKYKASHETLNSNFQRFRQYIQWCDERQLCPFSELGYKEYHYYLWQLILVDNDKKPLWDSIENDDVGIKEKTAYINFQIVEKALNWCGISAFKWNKTLKKIHAGKSTSFEAYSEKELPIILNRLSSYFFQLTLPLLSDELPKTIPVKISGDTINVSIKSDEKNSDASKINLDDAFNQAMICGYYLLSYFTAFNATQLIDICHPINCKKEKSQEYYELSAQKKRANSEVLAFIGGQIHKKSIEFIETMIAISLRYNTQDNGKLLYFLDGENNVHDFSVRKATQSKLNIRLLLISENVSKCIPHLLQVHSDFLETYSLGYISYIETKKNNNKIKKEKKVISVFLNKRIVTIQFALIMAIIYSHKKNQESTFSLKDAILPLKITECEFGLEVGFEYINGDKGLFYADTKYLDFLTEVQKYSKKRQSNRKNTPHYLLPFNTKSAPRQWKGLTPSMNDLHGYGIRVGDYFTSLASSRFRETSAKLARRKKNRSEIDISLILNNQYRTVMKHYSTENTQDNQLIISQGQRVIEKVSQGLSIDEGKAAVANELKISVIKYEELTNTEGNLNGIGIGCFQKKELAVDHSNACFDYENCLKCKYAKVVNDIEPMYRFLSFLECIEESWLYNPERYTKNLGKTINLYRKIISKNVSKDIINKAQFKLDSEGRHFLWDNLELSILGYKGI